MDGDPGWHVRRATAEDAASVARLNQHVHALHVDAEPDDFRAVEPADTQGFFASVLVGEDQVVLVASGAADVPIGYVWAQDQHRPENPFTAPARTLYIHHVAVSPDARRRGVARSLVAAVEAEARERGISRVALDHWTFNDTAQAFFVGMGYEPYNVRLRRDLSSEDGRVE